MMAEEQVLSASLEDYLEAIFHVVTEKQAAKAKDIAQKLNVKNSSVTGALRSLSKKGYINYAPYDIITLTPKGRTSALDIVRRHEALRDFFVKILGIEEEEAAETACRMEHTVSPAIIERLIRFLEFVELCPRAGKSWLDEFTRICREGETFGDCDECIAGCLGEMEEKKSAAGREVPFDEFTPGDKGRILKIKGRGGVKKKFADISGGPGNIIALEAVSDEDGARVIKVKGYRFSITREEAAKITAEPL